MLYVVLICKHHGGTYQVQLPTPHTVHPCVSAHGIVVVPGRRVPRGWTPILPAHPRCPLSQGSRLLGRPRGASWPPLVPPPTPHAAAVEAPVCLLLLLGLLLGLLLHLRGGHVFFLLGCCCCCCIPSWHVVSSNSERHLELSHHCYHSCRRRSRLQVFEKLSL